MATKKSPQNVLTKLLKACNLPANSTDKDIMRYFEAEKAKARLEAKTTSNWDEAWTPKLTAYGELFFARTHVRVSSDEIGPLIDELNSKRFEKFCEANESKIRTRAEIRLIKRQAKQKRLAEKTNLIAVEDIEDVEE